MGGGLVAVLIPHLRVPLQLIGGSFSTVEQDSAQEIEIAVTNVMRYEPGWRPEAPEFGLPDQTFRQGGARPEEVREVINAHEPRVEALVDQELVDMVSKVELELTGRDDG